jgi:hypothetical protein
MKILDLDTLRPESTFIKVGGKDIDVSFLPTAITWDVDKIIQELSSFTKELLLENKEETKRAFDLSIKLCAIFCEHKYPELNEKYFLENCDVNQIKVFVDSIKGTLFKAYNGIEIDSKNLKAAKKKT